MHQGVGLNPFRAIAQMLLAFWTPARRASLQIASADLMMTVAIAASSSFASPLSHPARLLVMGPGGYKFMDYVKVGVP